jgi:holo-[acyl-carrier protein] synthase
MIKGVGIDIESTLRIGKLLGRYDSATLQMIFTRDELARCHSASNPAGYLTVCFSAKEAMGKALGTGLATIDWNDIEVDIQHNQLVLTLRGKALKQAQLLGASWWQSSWSYVNDHVVVIVMLGQRT